MFALCAAAGLVIWFGVDVEKGRRDACDWAEERKGRMEKQEKAGERGEDGLNAGVAGLGRESGGSEDADPVKEA